jgi:hypothetical protein
MHANLLPRAGARNLIHRAPRVVTHKLRDAIDHHLRCVGSLYAESAGVRFLPQSVGMPAERVAPAEAIPIVHVFAQDDHL